MVPGFGRKGTVYTMGLTRMHFINRSYNSVHTERPQAASWRIVANTLPRSALRGPEKRRVCWTMGTQTTRTGDKIKSTEARHTRAPHLSFVVYARLLEVFQSGLRLFVPKLFQLRYLGRRYVPRP